MNHFPHLKVPMGAGASSDGGAAELSAGDYWADGDVSLAPVVGNYTSTTRFSDGVSGDQTTRENSTGSPITVIRVEASPATLTSWKLTAFYTGSVADTYWYWNGSAWVEMNDLNDTLWNNHAIGSFESRTAGFDGAVTAAIFRAALTVTTGLGISDARLNG